MLDLLAEDTIAAIATAIGPAPHGIIRISGGNTNACLRELIGQESKGSTFLTRKNPCAFEATLVLKGMHRVPAEILYWPTQKSYTRQPSAEIHLAGSPPLLNLVLQEICQRGVRLAQPGEFTLRAFLSGRIDLTQAEAVIGAIDAEDEVQFGQALSQLAGGLTHPFVQLRSDLIDLLADIEAGLDFADEDISFIKQTELLNSLDEFIQRMEDLRDQIESRSESQSFSKVVLVGRPNVGKSSLFNCIAERNLAIVSPQAGTTTDYLSARIAFCGFEFELVDTAGIDHELSRVGDVPDAMPTGVAADSFSNSRKQLESADLVILCLDSTVPPTTQEISWLRQLSAKQMFVVETKCDLAASCIWTANAVRVSSASRFGVNEFLEKIVEKLHHSSQNSDSAVFSTTLRCHESIKVAYQALQLARHAAFCNDGEELVATEIRIALDSIGQIIGVVQNDEILDRLFSRFCIGK